MANHDNTLVLLLAGGVGSRLNILVRTRAKPAVPFGGIYRIIDFSLSNVMNSGMSRVGVLTQYKPLSLMNHLGIGEAWDLSGRTRGIKILPPRTGATDSDWYKGTADAVRQNIDFIRAHPSKEIIILSGDHIYHMDLADMLAVHRRKKANLTIGMMRVPLEQIHQFGAGIVNENDRIIDWEEKPTEPKTDLASMGIYVFDTEYMLRVLEEERQENDFGMHIIPRAISRDRVYAYPFRGYWRDVGTIQAYWQANMDLLDPASGIRPAQWGIRPNPDADGREADRPAARFAAGSKVNNSLISAGCVIEGEVSNSILSPGIRVEAGAVVRNSVLIDDCVIEAGAVVDLAIMDKRVRVGRRAVVGLGDNLTQVNSRYPQHLYTGITLLGKDAAVPPVTTIGRNCIISPLIKEDSFPGREIVSGTTIDLD
ncbi:MAG TPA: glucose-1-phosphate adenylyltransferase [Desulfobacterales bacterium]|nr:glucose-1-phosphate adenylyltransferase [Desulfobacterales bacterium]